MLLFLIPPYLLVAVQPCTEWIPIKNKKNVVFWDIKNARLSGSARFSYGLCCFFFQVFFSVNISNLKFCNLKFWFGFYLTRKEKLGRVVSVLLIGFLDNLYIAKKKKSSMEYKTCPNCWKKVGEDWRCSKVFWKCSIALSFR